MIVYVFALVERDGTWIPPRVAWLSAADARASAVAYVADRLVGSDEADTLLAWGEEPERHDGRYSVFTAPTKYGRVVRVWPIEVMSQSEGA